MIETVMIGAESQRGIYFTSRDKTVISGYSRAFVNGRDDLLLIHDPEVSDRPNHLWDGAAQLRFAGLPANAQS